MGNNKKKGGENMEEKILDAIDKKFNEINEKFDQKFELMEQRFDQKFEEMDQKFDQKFNEIHQELTQIRNRQFLFEQEYGTKIDAIFDAVSLELDKNKEKSEKIRKLEKRVDRNEVQIFSHEKRISRLELNH